MDKTEQIEEVLKNHRNNATDRQIASMMGVEREVVTNIRKRMDHGIVTREAEAEEIIGIIAQMDHITGNDSLCFFCGEYEEDFHLPDCVFKRILKFAR